MEWSRNIMAFQLWIFLFFSDPIACLLLRDAHLIQTTGLECQALQLGNSWSSESKVHCSLECLNNYPDTCGSILYDGDTQTCTPGSVAFGTNPLLTTTLPGIDSDDPIFYVKQPTPPCDSNPNFALYDVCGTSLCLHLSTSTADYDRAVGNCSAMNSRLFVGNTLAKFSVYWYVSLEQLKNTWIGLTDVVTENTFVWENGETMSDTQWAWSWPSGYPNSYLGEEDCAEARHKDWQGRFGLNDASCTVTNYYVCELLP